MFSIINTQNCLLVIDNIVHWKKKDYICTLSQNFMLLKETIRQVILQQRDTLAKSEKGIKRDYNFTINNSFATIMTGIRRCGKSTLISQLIENMDIWYYLNLEDPKLIGFEVKDFVKVEEIMYELFGEGGVFFFDEIQIINDWEKFIRYLVDKKARVVITGSNASMLSSELATRLTGRHLKHEIFPFSYHEFLKLKNKEDKKESLDIYLSKGGFPEYLKQDNPEILNQLFLDIVVKDIVVRYGLRNVEMIKRLAVFLLTNIGMEFSFNALKKLLQVKSVQSVIDYVHYLENSYMIFTIHRFSYSLKQQQVSPRKVYCIDNGFSGANSVAFSKDKGRMLENLVFLELKKRNHQVFYFRKDMECDFVIKDGAKVTQVMQVCVEIHDENIDREILGLLEAMKEFKLSTGSIITLHQEDTLKRNGKNITMIPFQKWVSV
jgi:uncharacterized protein